MPPKDITAQGNGFRFSREVSMTSILTALTMLIALFAAWSNIQVRISVLEQRMNDLVIAVNNRAALHNHAVSTAHIEDMVNISGLGGNGKN